jgi:hypothetical protein
LRAIFKRMSARQHRPDEGGRRAGDLLEIAAAVALADLVHALTAGTSAAPSRRTLPASMPGT